MVGRTSSVAELCLSIGSDRERAVQAARLWFRLCPARLFGEPGRLVLETPGAFDWFSSEPFAYCAGVTALPPVSEYDDGIQTYSEESWRQLLDYLGELPEVASFEIHRNNERGRRYLPTVTVGCRTDGDWLVLSSVIDDAVANDPDGQQAVLEVMREVAELVNPSAGSVFAAEGTLQTPLELALHDHSGPRRSREVLRDYGWLTIVAEELGQRLGGVEALRASGAFVEVEHLAAGGFWCLATRSWDEYGWPQAERLFEVFAPVLPPGRPVVRRERLAHVGGEYEPWQSQNFVVERDPREVTAQA